MNVVFAHGLGLEGNRGRRTCSRRAIGHVLSRLCLLWVGISVTTTCATTAVAEQTQSPSDTSGLAKSVTIYRDAFGTPHIDGANDAAVVFGFAYAQAEDFFWQIEDTYILALGRYAEILGTQGPEF